MFLFGWTAGPLAAVALIAGVGPEAAFWLPCGLFLLAALAVAAMRVGDAGQCGRAEAQAAGIRDSGLRELARGFTALWQDRALRVLAIAVLIIAAVYMPTEAVILPAYFNDLQDPAGLGIVIAAISGGSMIGAFGFPLGLVWGPLIPPLAPSCSGGSALRSRVGFTECSWQASTQHRRSGWSPPESASMRSAWQ